VKPAIEPRGCGNALTPSALALFRFSLLLPYTIEAEDADKRARDKSGYNLLLPTPPEMMRELSADRPDKTDSPFTIDAGHFQVEMDIANLTYDRTKATKFTAYEIAPMNLKVGLLNSLDFQLVYTAFRWEQTVSHDTVTVVHRSSLEFITPRLKLNIAGNDGGILAVALLPFVKLPLHKQHIDNGAIEAGLGIPFAFDIPDWDVGFQTTFRGNRDQVGSGYHSVFDNSVSVGHSLIGKLSIAVEFFSSVRAEPRADWIGTFDTWLTYQINPNLRLDGGAYLGVTSEADDLHPFIGATWRF
jgi:hypothetical protein